VSKFIKITKYNILDYYHRAHKKSFTEMTVQTAFCNTGIWPIDQTVIEDDAFAPALNTSTRAAQPVLITLSTLLEPYLTPLTLSETLLHIDEPLESFPNIDDTHLMITNEPSPSISKAVPYHLSYSSYHLIGLPPPLSEDASPVSHKQHIVDLQGYCACAKTQMEADHASKKLMEAENQQICALLFEKSRKHTKRHNGGS
jgi:hypothetical protein